MRCSLTARPSAAEDTAHIVVPGLTKSYSEGGKAGEAGGIPMCTLRNFPHLIEHCIEWSRSLFEDLFVSPARQAAVFLDNPAAFVAKIRAATIEQPPSGLLAAA